MIYDQSSGVDYRIKCVLVCVYESVCMCVLSIHLCLLYRAVIRDITKR